MMLTRKKACQAGNLFSSDRLFTVDNFDGCDNRIQAMHTAEWNVLIAGMLFQTRSNSVCKPLHSEVQRPVLLNGC